jgi:hypothetical protein
MSMGSVQLLVLQAAVRVQLMLDQEERDERLGCQPYIAAVGWFTAA